MLSEERKQELIHLDCNVTNGFEAFEDMKLNEEEKEFVQGLEDNFCKGVKAALEKNKY